MSKRYSIAEARAQLPQIVNEASHGNTIEITRRGKPVAVVLSLEQFETLSNGRTSFGDAYRQFCGHYDLAEIGLDAEFAAELRDRSDGRKISL